MNFTQQKQNNLHEPITAGRHDEEMDCMDEMQRLDALFYQNTPLLEVDTRKLWQKIEPRLDKQPRHLPWSERLLKWMQWVPDESESIFLWQKPLALAACLVLLIFSTWIVRDQTILIEQWQVLIQIDKAWTGNPAIHPVTDENPFILLDDKKSDTNPFENVTS